MGGLLTSLVEQRKNQVMTTEELDARIEAKMKELQALTHGHESLLKQHDETVKRFNEQVSANQTQGCKIQGALDELRSLKDSIQPKETTN